MTTTPTLSEARSDASSPRPDSPVDARCERLSQASLRRIVEPEEEFDFSALGSGQVIPDDLLSVRDLDVSLAADERARLSREEVAAMLQAGIAFESILDAALSLMVAERYQASDPRVTYMLHEIGEETRHSRAFAALVRELRPVARNPLDRAIPRFVVRRIARTLLNHPALLMVFVLAGEEIPDLFQKLASEHPDTDPLLASVNRYHRQEEARHLTFARTVLPELWEQAGWFERLRIRRTAPIAIRGLFDTFVHPGVYETVGLPGWQTWQAVNCSPSRVAVRHAATRPILATLLEHGMIRRGRVPRAWRHLCGVDRFGEPVGTDVPLPGRSGVEARSAA